MKKTLKTIFIAFTAVLSLAFTGCFNDIYGYIESEVALETGIQGDIYSIVRYRDDLYLSNGKIYKKSTTLSSVSPYKMNGQWTMTFNPSSDTSDDIGQFVTLASDENYLYGLAVNTAEDDDGDNTESSRGVYYSTDGANWTQLSVSGTIQTVFCNNAKDSTKRNAYIKLSGYAPMLLSGSTAITTSSTTVSSGSVKYCGSLTDCYSCCYFTDSNNISTDFFAPYDSITAGDHYVYYSKEVSSDYSSSMTKLYYNDGTTEYSVSPDAGVILSAAACSDYILLGTNSGLARVKIDTSTGVPESSTTAFTNNGSSIFSIYSFLTFVVDPELTMAANDMYATATIRGSISSSGTSFSNTGLYAYYSHRDLWNKDGTSSSTGN